MSVGCTARVRRPNRGIRGSVAALALVCAACGGVGQTAAGVTTDAAVERGVRVAFVVVAGDARGEHAARGLAALGDAGVAGSDVVVAGSSGLSAALVDAAQEHGVVVTFGGGTLEAVAEAAKLRPAERFIVVEGSAADPLVRGLDNVSGISFRDEEFGYVAGAQAALALARPAFAGRPRVVAAIGGERSPDAERVLAGFVEGVRATAPDVTVWVAWSNEVVRAEVCYDLAARLVGEGAQVLLPLAGGCGDGVVSAAADLGVRTIGVPGTPGDAGPGRVGSVALRLDVLVSQAIRSVLSGAFAGATDWSVGLREGVVATVAGADSSAAASAADVDAAIKRTADAGVAIATELPGDVAPPPMLDVAAEVGAADPAAADPSVPATGPPTMAPDPVVTVPAEDAG